MLTSMSQRLLYFLQKTEGRITRARVEAGAMSLPIEQRKVHNSSVTGLKDVKETAYVCLCAEVLRILSKSGTRCDCSTWSCFRRDWSCFAEMTVTVIFIRREITVIENRREMTLMRKGLILLHRKCGLMRQCCSVTGLILFRTRVRSVAAQSFFAPRSRCRRQGHDTAPPGARGLYQVGRPL